MAPEVLICSPLDALHSLSGSDDSRNSYRGAAKPAQNEGKSRFDLPGRAASRREDEASPTKMMPGFPSRSRMFMNHSVLGVGVCLAGVSFHCVDSILDEVAGEGVNL